MYADLEEVYADLDKVYAYRRPKLIGKSCDASLNGVKTFGFCT